MSRIVTKISYEQAMRRFAHLYRQEKLPVNNPEGSEWFAINDEACACLVWFGQGRKQARIKGTITAPECRGLGLGEEMLLHLIEHAKENECTRLEVFARNPNWYLKHGFTVKRQTTYGVTVCEMKISLA